MILLTSLFGLAQAGSITCPKYAVVGTKTATICDGVVSTDTGQMTGGFPDEWLRLLADDIPTTWTDSFALLDGTVDLDALGLRAAVALPLDSGYPIGDVAALVHGDLDGDGVEDAAVAAILPQGDGTYTLSAAIYLTTGDAIPVGDPDLRLEATLAFGVSGFALMPLPAWSLVSWELLNPAGDGVARGSGGLLSWSADLGDIGYEAVALRSRTGWTVGEWSSYTGDLGTRETVGLSTLTSTQAAISYTSSLSTAASTWTGSLTGASTSTAWGFSGLSTLASARSTATGSLLVFGSRTATWTSTNGGKYVVSAALPNAYTAASAVEADATIADLLDAIGLYAAPVEIYVPSTAG